VNNSYSILIWIGVLAVIFALLWWSGQLTRLAAYVRETRVELEKCSWPTWAELKGSTIVIFIAILMLSAFTYVVDKVFYFFIRIIT
jgi:preprotein translocase subunit SecE